MTTRKTAAARAAEPQSDAASVEAPQLEQVTLVAEHTHRGVTYPAGTPLEVRPATKTIMQEQGVI